jgi:hypothetical protein
VIVFKSRDAHVPPKGRPDYLSTNVDLCVGDIRDTHALA